MIEKKSEEAFTPEWVTDNIADQANELVVLREIIPWQKIINGLTPFCNDTKGRTGISLRTVTGVFIIRKLRDISDRQLVGQVGENRCIQYFRDVSDEDLKTFVNHGSLCKTRQRSGEEGIAVVESEISDMPNTADVIKGDTMPADSTVLPADMIYPTDIGLIFEAFGKMRRFAEKHGIPLWWDDKETKTLRREFGLNKNKNKFSEYL